MNKRKLERTRRTRNRYEYTLIFLLYVFISLAFTYPLITRLTTHIAGLPSDTYFHVWNIWWWKFALLKLHTNPFFASYNFYPVGASLYFSTTTPSNALLSIPLQLVTNVEAAYNTLLIGTFVLSAFTMYLLARHLTNQNTGSFIAGLVYSFCPKHVRHSFHHLNIASVQWFPLYILFLLKMLETKKRRYVLLTAAAAALIGYSELQYLAYAGIMTVLVVILRVRSVDKKTLANLATVFLLVNLLMLPLSVPIIKNLRHLPKESEGRYSAVACSFIAPVYQYNTILNGKIPKLVECRFDEVEGANFIGLTILLLVFLGLILDFRKTAQWFLFALVFLALSLGSNTSALDSFGTTPFSLLKKIPLFSAIRTPSRMSIITMLFLAIVSSFGVKEFLARTKSIKQKIIRSSVNCAFITIILVGLTLEFNVYPYPSFHREYSSSYTSGVFQNPGAVLDIPLGIMGEHLYYQIKHEKPTLYGRVSYFCPGDHDRIMAFYNKNPTLRSITVNQKMDGKNHTSSESLRTFLMENEIRYIILHKEWLRGELLENYDKFMSTIMTRAFEDDKIIVFRERSDS